MNGKDLIPNNNNNNNNNAPYKIKYDDENLIIVSKHAGIGIYELVNLLNLEHQFLVLTPCPKAMKGGLVAIAKNKASLDYFKQDKNKLQFTFLGLCIGKFDKKELKITDNLSNHEATTIVKVISTHQSNSAGYISLVELTCGLHTTFWRNQFRRHLYGINHPIIGKVASCKKLKNQKTKLALSCIKICSSPSSSNKDTKSSSSTTTNVIHVEIPHYPLPFMEKIIKVETEYFNKKESSSQIYQHGKQKFLNHEFYVNKHVLIPKKSSETIVNVAYNIMKSNNNNSNNYSYNILDCGTGCGCLLLSLLLKCKNNNLIDKVKYSVGIDISQDALNVAIENAKNLILNNDANNNSNNNNNNITFCLKSFENINELMKDYAFNIVICNPPYLTTKRAKATLDYDILKEEPELSYLVPGIDGLLFYRQVATSLIGKKVDDNDDNDKIKQQQKKNKRRKIEKEKSNENVLHLIFEVPHYLIASCNEMLFELGYVNIEIHKDENGFDRCLSCVFVN